MTHETKAGPPNGHAPSARRRPTASPPVAAPPGPGPEGAQRRDPRRTLGEQGEQHVRRYLEMIGYEILATNWRCADGEIDIVALDGREVVVVEVKTRRTRRFGPAVEAVTHEKHLRLRRLAYLWLREQEVDAAAMRIDVIGVDLDGSEVRLDHRRRVIL